MATATVTAKGQVTIPVDVRTALGLHAGDRLHFIEQADGSYSIRPATRSVADVKGFFGPWEGPPVTIEQMDQAIAEAVSDNT